MNHDLRTALSRFFLPLVTAILLLPCVLSGDEVIRSKETGELVGRVFLDENADTFFKECDCDCALENIPVRLYQNDCGGLIVQTVRTDAEGYFHFKRLEPAEYCIRPDVKLICEGYQPTKSITQKAEVKPGETTKVEWFAFDHFFDTNQ